ncbi:MAG: hypothetical protein CVU44_21500 [Chloroflexi bacterium HGW-Chloroflexi-6]|nr:MAG: hypothetical protein CVU44_21500 [Chloroflexi bacterium HGW-Chloroflexi-6]
MSFSIAKTVLFSESEAKMPKTTQTASLSDTQWKSVYILGAIAAILSLLAVVADIVIGSSSGSNLTELPQTAVERFAQFQLNPWLGLYNLDLLNTVNQLISIPVFFALYAAHRKTNPPYSLLGLIIFLTGTTIFAANNVALPMLELSHKYAAASEAQKSLLAAAGEALLVRGEHGSLGVFFSFSLPTLAALMFSLVMLQGKIFSKANAWVGIIGNVLMLAYVVLVTFAPAVKEMAMAFAMPGGLLLLAWMVMLTIRLFQLGTAQDSQ